MWLGSSLDGGIGHIDDGKGQVAESCTSEIKSQGAITLLDRVLTGTTASSVPLGQVLRWSVDDDERARRSVAAARPRRQPSPPI